MQAGIRVSRCLAATGEREAALTALEEMTALFERFYALRRHGLTYRCPALDQLRATVEYDMRQGPAVGEDWNIRHSMRHIGCQDWSGLSYPTWISTP